MLRLGSRIRHLAALIPNEWILPAIEVQELTPVVVPKRVQMASTTAAVLQAQSVPVWIRAQSLIYPSPARLVQPRWLAESHRPAAV